MATDPSQLKQAIDILVRAIKQISPSNMLNSRKRLAPQNTDLDIDIKAAVNTLQQSADNYYSLYTSGRLQNLNSHLPFVSSIRQIASQAGTNSIATPLNELLSIVQQLNPNGQDRVLNNTKAYLDTVKKYLDTVVSMVSGTAVTATQSPSGATVTKKSNDLLKKLLKVASKIEKKYYLT